MISLGYTMLIAINKLKNSIKTYIIIKQIANNLIFSPITQKSLLLVRARTSALVVLLQPVPVQQVAVSLASLARLVAQVVDAHAIALLAVALLLVAAGAGQDSLAEALGSGALAMTLGTVLLEGD